MSPKMWKLLFFHFSLAVVASRTESCFQKSFLQVHVPAIIQPGNRILKVDVSDCLRKSATLTLSDPSFTINGAGRVEAAAPVAVSAGGRTFFVRARDGSGASSQMAVRLIQTLPRDGKRHKGEVLLRRFKRRWSPPPINILENEKPPFPREIEKLESDSAATHDVYYTISGPGFNQHPTEVFTLDNDSGMLSVHRSVDREEFPSFTLIVRVFDRTTNQELDDPLPFSIIVDDVNDNAPTFVGSLQVTVPENSNAGTVVGKLNATDRDQADTLHVKIRYSLLDGLDRFAIHPSTGVITTTTGGLDRETKDKYLVTVKIQDMDGAARGLSDTATATIMVGDVNDNPPTFTKPSYEISVKENEKDKLVLEIPVQDKDLVNSPNWVSKFLITKGNENGNFRIDTDPKTNGGRLYVSKALDHEKSKSVKLEITARNEAELSGGGAWNSIPVGVAVTDVDEGPEFSAGTIVFNVKENEPNGTLIGRYTALDPETKTSNGITYYKVNEPAAWVNMDRHSGDLKVANTIDRESKFVSDGRYTFTVKAVDAASKTGTGTVILQIEDLNDNKPTLPTGELLICEREGQLGSTVVVAEDKDSGHYASPFSFSLPPDNDGKWALETINATAAVLRQVKDLPRNLYKVDVDVKDLQSNGGIQTVLVRICQCRNGACVAKEHSATLGSLAWLAMLLPLALLLLFCLLMAFLCVTKKEKMEMEDVGDSGGILLKSNTEAPGEEVDSSLITVPPFGVDPGIKGTLKGNAGAWAGGQGSFAQGTLKTGVYKSDIQDLYGQYDSQYGAQQFNRDYLDGGVAVDTRLLARNASFLHTWQTNGRYLQQRLPVLSMEEDERYAEDTSHDYRFEGAGSAAGSVGCCSDFGNDDDLGFLNALGPKFKTLADVCKKT